MPMTSNCKGSSGAPEKPLPMSLMKYTSTLAMFETYYIATRNIYCNSTSAVFVMSSDNGVKASLKAYITF